MGSVNGDDSIPWDVQSSSAQEERIFVSVRLRPMNEKELARNDVPDWECINSTTIIYKNISQERSMFPTGYTFDRVFGSDSSTRQVYEEAAKNVVFSVVNGINASIFAYGQTSSGKTYTMSGITEYTIEDIFDYINKHEDREFVLKFSAMEIYNECVRDLLSSDNMPLRLLDDPERGTVVEKLTEVNLRDWNHLKELLSVCEAQRQIGETSLNEMSSRSHQILRLTVDSSVRKYVGSQNSSTLTATVNFVDLAGSERASQTLSVNTRLKEGCHINRSLLTLGTVIRKLSKGRNGHVPYRDSKLTRILQNSLGGNARTAIICTVSPAHSHVEQSRNTLLFASCAKQVSTNAQVNVVMSEKALVKQLQKELLRLENELRTLGSISGSCDSISALKEKELLLEKKDKEIIDLTRQRDLAQSRLQDIMQSGGEFPRTRSWADMSNLSEKVPWFEDYPASEASEIVDPLRLDVPSNLSHFSDRFEVLDSNKADEVQFPETEDQFLSDDTSPTAFIDKYFGPDPSKGWEKIAHTTEPNVEDICKEVQCIEIDDGKINTSSDTISSAQQNEPVSVEDNDVEELKKTSDGPIDTHPTEQSTCSSDTETSDSRNLDMLRSRSCTVLPTMSLEKDIENVPTSEVEVEVAKEIPETFESDEKVSEVDLADNKLGEKDDKTKLCDELKVSELSDEADKPKLQKLSGDNQVLEVEEISKKSEEFSDDSLKKVDDSQQSPSNWSSDFERQRREIIELWDACNITLVHRTYFFLLFKGEPSDSIYMEVELRRLSYLRSTLSRGTCVGKSARALNRERTMLAKQILKKFSSKERDALFEKWGIGLKTKQRRLQLCRRLWTDTKDMEHIKESAALVAKLVGIVEPSHAPKEIFGLSLPQSPNFRSYSWKPSLTLPGIM